MNDKYVMELIQMLSNTKFYIDDSRELDYESGIKEMVDCFIKHKRDKTQIFFVGNGGSSAIASHMTADFMKNGGMKTYNLYDNALTTCMGNDYGYEYIFSKPLGFLGQENDILVAVSSSGNSQNIVNAINVANMKGMETVTLTGFQINNRIRQIGRKNIYVPSKKYGIVESIHNLILQQIVDLIMERDGIEL